MKVFTQLGNYPGLTMKASINSMICFGYRVFGESETRVLSAWDYPGWSSDVNDDRDLIIAARAILDSADAIVTHNGKRFDWKFLQTRLLFHGLPPLPRIPHLDTCAIAKSNLFLFNNKLNTVAKALTDQQKMDNGGWDLWCNVLKRDPPSMKLMAEYCAQDVNTLLAVFKRLRPFFQTVPNYNLFSVCETRLCPSCGSTRICSNGYRSTKTVSYKRYKCLDCGASSRTDLSDRNIRSI